MPSNTDAPARRRSPLRREDVLATTLRLIDADGVEALSMRRMGRALDRDPMRLYRFASSKDELLDGVVELVLGELRVPTAEAGNWDDVLLELLVGAGFDERGALHAYRLYMGFLQGHVLNELQERVYDPEETDDLLRLG